jgi:hypothetical protein
LLLWIKFSLDKASLVALKTPYVYPGLRLSLLGFALFREGDGWVQLSSSKQQSTTLSIMKTSSVIRTSAAFASTGPVRHSTSQALFQMFGLSLFLALLIGGISHALGAGVMITGGLANFDVRYPPSLPNDLEIIIYGDGLKPGDVIDTWDSSIPLGDPPVAAGWGKASSITPGVNTDPTSPAFGLDCVIVRYAGPPNPAAVGHMLHFGVRLRVGAAVAHQEVWWTLNGQRILRPCDPHVTWICTTRGWLICIANPTPNNIYVYGVRYFEPAPTGRLPLLSDLTTYIQPEAFGATSWTSVPLPSLPGVPAPHVYCIPPWCRIYIRVVTTTWRPIIFQVAARNVPDEVFPLPQGTAGPNPNDWNGEQGTMAILSGRSTQEYGEDVNGDGAVGLPDFNMLRTRFGTVSEDFAAPAQ